MVRDDRERAEQKKKKFVEENLNLILCLCATCNNLLVIVQIEFYFF